MGVSTLQEPERRNIEERARFAERDGKFTLAASLYADIGQLGASVRCSLSANDHARAYATLLRIPREDALYRDACVLAIRLASTLDRVDFDFDQFVGRFLMTSPATANEAEAFYAAAVLFERHGFVENAKDVLTQLVGPHPDFRDAQARLEALEAESRPSLDALRQVVKEDHAFRQAGRDRPSGRHPVAKKEETFPSLPEIPEAHRKGNSMPPSRSRDMLGDPDRPSRSRDVATMAAGHSSNPPPAPRVSPVPLSPSQPEAALHSPTPEDRRRLPPISDLYAIPTGFLVAERYRIDSLIGRGGMAVVYKAHDLELDEVLAIKLFAYGLGDPTMVSRFKQELALCRQITHDNVIRLYDIGTHNDARFFTMELLSGKDLCDRLDDPPDVIRDLGYLVQLCQGLQCVHEKGVVHRDLKPENIFVTDAGVVKLMDFGIAKRRSAGGGITMGGFSAGTPAYMAPEQINDFASATHLSDLYSIGILAYRLFTGVLPFEHETAMAILVKHLNEAPKPPSVHEPAIPDELEYLILQLLEKDPSRRVQSCRELARDLSALRSRLMEARRPRSRSR